MNISPRTPEENKATIRLLYEEALQQGRLELIEKLFSPDFIDHSTPGQIPGHAGVRDYFLALRSGFPDLQVTLEDLIAEDDRVAVRTNWQGTHLGVYEGTPSTGKKTSRSLIQIFRLENGLLVEEWNAGPGLLSSSQ